MQRLLPVRRTGALVGRMRLWATVGFASAALSACNSGERPQSALDTSSAPVHVVNAAMGVDTAERPIVFHVSSDMQTPISLSQSRNIALKAKTVAPTVASTLVRLAAPPKDLTCITPVTATDVQNGQFHFENAMLSHAEAVSANLPVAQAAANNNSTYLVVDYRRSAECKTSDPETSLEYGQTITTIIELTNFSGTAQASFAAIAADGTLNNKTQRITVSTNGISNPKLLAMIASVNNKELNVPNFAAFDKFLSDITTLPDDGQTKTTVQFLGKRVKTDYASALVTAFALEWIRDGKSCEVAKQDLPSGLKPLVFMVQATYTAIASSCDSSAPSRLSKDMADEYLSGVKVKT